MLSPPAEEFLTWLAVEKGRSANTLAAYRRDLSVYEEWLAFRARTLEQVAEADIEDYVAALRHQGRAPSTVARALVAVRSLHRFTAAETAAVGVAALGGEVTDPAAEVGVPKVPQGLPHPLTEEETERLLQTVVGNEPWQLRDRALLELLYGTGMRISEAVGLSLSDLALDDGIARVLGKGNKERIVPVGRLARVALAEWLGAEGRARMAPGRWKRRDDADAVFLNQRGGRLTRQGAWGVVKKYGAVAGVADKLSPHVLRHSCATHMLDHGADLRVVQDLLGHASVATTQVYTKVSTERLRSVYEAAHPRARQKGTGR